MTRAKYYISFDTGANWSEFWPTNEPKITWVQESGEIFMRYKVDVFKIGRTKNETVFDIINEMFFDSADFGTLVQYKINVLGTDKFTFIDSITSGDLNRQNSIYESRPETDDVYRPIMLQYKKKWKLGTDSITSAAYVYYPTLNAASFSNIDFTTFSDTAHSITYTNNTAGRASARDLMDQVVTNLTTCLVVIKNLAYTGIRPEMQLIDGATFVSCSNVIPITANGIYTITASASPASQYLELAQQDVTGSTGSFDYEVYHYHNYTSAAGASFQLTVRYIIQNVAYMNLATDVISTFLSNEALPTGHAVNTPNISTFMGANPNSDYVIQGVANWNLLVLGRADAWTTTKEVNFDFSLQEVMEVIKKKLRAWWYIDEDGKFRIEHERYFRDYISQADLTTVTYTGDKPEVDVKNYRYEKTSLFNQINYSELNQLNKDWIAKPVEFDVNKTSQDSSDVSINLSTDIKYLVDNPTTAASSGFFLAKCIDMNGNYRVVMDESTETPGSYIANARLGWYYLCLNYYKYFAEAGAGTINGGTAITYSHVKEFLKQENIKFRMAADLDWKKPVTLTLGTGWIETAEYSPETGMYKINVGFDPYYGFHYTGDYILCESGMPMKDENGDYLMLE